MAKSVYEMVTDRIISQLESGVIPWEKLSVHVNLKMEPTELDIPGWGMFPSGNFKCLLYEGIPL